MIEVKNGNLTIKGDAHEVLNEYAATTGRVLEEILSENRFDLDYAENLSPESRAAAGYMANLETALSRHTYFNRKDFYDAMFRVLRLVRATYES